MAQDPESTTEVLQVLETTEATAEQSEIAIAPVVLPSEARLEVVVEAPALKEKPSQASELKETRSQDHQKVVVHDDEHVTQMETEPATELEPEPESLSTGHTKIAFANELDQVDGEDRGGVEVMGDALSEEGLKTKMQQERKQRRKEAINIRYSFGTTVEEPTEVDNKEDMVGEEGEEHEEHQEEHQEEDKEEHQEEHQEEDKEDYKDEERLGSNVSILEEEESDMEEHKFRFKGAPTRGIFGALKQDAVKDDQIFYKDSKYDNIECPSAMSIKSIKSSKSIKLITSQTDTVQLKSDFLRNFEMPSLSDISEEWEPDYPPRKDLSITSMEEDKGYFVDPTTGAMLSSSTSSDQISLFGQEDQDDTAAAVELQEGSSEISEMHDSIVVPYAEAKKKALTFDDLHDSFVALQSKFQVEDEEKSPMKEFGVDTIVHDFVDDLLLKIVTTYETQRLDDRLRLKCDKTKLANELRNITDTYICEKATNDLLNTRLADYYKRLRNNRVFAQLNEEQTSYYYKRYFNALCTVDNMKLHVDTIKHKYAAQINKVILHLQGAHSVVFTSETVLEQKMRKYLVRPDSDFLKRYVDWALRQMNAKRSEISDMRIRLITKQHTVGHLQARLKELETLSSTVSIQDYISIQNDVINLQKKIEERNLDLSKIRNQYLMDVHHTYHNREKALALEDKLQLKRITLSKAINKQRSLRAKLYSEKLERTQIREKRKELTYQGGILAMPSLMYEYDNTVEQVKESQERVAKLKDTVKAITRRVSLLTARSL